ncbi:PREDICTED: mas-related G-protein coupled receptor member X1-like [Nanorana parkeri]|uniref:mas-related G-protein coupled receptor member X1-like n=1 Tax=Nanorana parkeri TaxID=125878 RepID=UPI000854F670|nr:PREDICTED: mas-related G-protein coupled receptor member X1-like [Nanorana parkeri]
MSNLTSNDTSLQPSPKDPIPWRVETALCVITVLFCVLGLVGNTIVMFYFCFRIKLSQSTVYILNLAVADFLFSAGCCIFFIYLLCLFNGVATSAESKSAMAKFGELLISFTYNASLLFLVTLSCERCLLVCFPLWYKCRRPTYLSAILSAVMWVFSLLITVLERFLIPDHRSTVYIVTSAVFLLLTLLMVGSSVVFLIQIQKSSAHCRPLKLYIVVVAAIINYLISLAPSRILRMVFFLAIVPTSYMRIISIIVICLCSAFNSAANPYIYIIVGRWKKKISTKQALELAFREDSQQTSEENITMGSQRSDSESKPEAPELDSSRSL